MSLPSSNFNSLVQGLLNECQNTFSEDTVYYIGGETSNSFELRGIFEDRSEIVDILSEAGAVVSVPGVNYHNDELASAIDAATASVRDTASTEDTILIRTKVYNVISVEPDERGDVMLKLQEVED